MELGVKIGKMCIDVLAYADDILIITHTKINMQLMLNRLSELGEELEIKFNPNKSVYMVFNAIAYQTKNE
jgi:hypothetical protein